MTTATIVIALPADVAERAEQVEREHPGFLARALTYVTMREGVYRHLRHRDAVLLEAEEHGRKVLAENGEGASS
jgi:hypothetical protein